MCDSTLSVKWLRMFPCLLPHRFYDSGPTEQAAQLFKDGRTCNWTWSPPSLKGDCWEVQGHLEPPIQRCAIWGYSPFVRHPNCPVVIRTHLHSYSPPQFHYHKLRGMYHNSCMHMQH